MVWGVTYSMINNNSNEELKCCFDGSTAGGRKLHEHSRMGKHRIDLFGNMNLSSLELLTQKLDIIMT